MNQRERQNNRPASPGGGGDSGGNLDELRDRAQRFLAAGDEAINRALAGSQSETFLRSNRQQGGQ